jgi:hypothetical protein
MQLSSNEKSWLPWFGKIGKFAMGWSCRLKRSAYPVIEQTFEAIADTRGRYVLTRRKSKKRDTHTLEDSENSAAH